MTQLFTTIASLRHYLNNQKSKKNIGQPLANVSVGLIPTMGALHTGHLSLIDRARKENVCVVVSIFVNLLQFGAGEDFEQYPRNLETDLHTCETAGVDAIFAPSVEEMGVTAAKVTQVIPPSEMTDFLCGRSRVGHFQGVATIVTKLLNIVQPDRAYFGNKDGQQLAIIRQLVNDLNIPVEIIGCPTLREPSGLATVPETNIYQQEITFWQRIFIKVCNKLSSSFSLVMDFAHPLRSSKLLKII